MTSPSGHLQRCRRGVRGDPRAGRGVDALALNAGRGIGGDFTREAELADELNVIDVNITSTVHLAKRALPAIART